MELIIAYVLFNIIVARFLEHKRYRAGIIAHAVLFTVLLVGMFALSPDATTSMISRRIMGDTAFEGLRTALGCDETASQAELFAPIAVIETVMIISGLSAAAIITKKVIDTVMKRAGKRNRFVAENEKVYFRDPTKERTRRYKIYLKNCAMLC